MPCTGSISLCWVPNWAVRTATTVPSRIIAVTRTRTDFFKGTPYAVNFLEGNPKPHPQASQRAGLLPEVHAAEDVGKAGFVGGRGKNRKRGNGGIRSLPYLLKLLACRELAKVGSRDPHPSKLAWRFLSYCASFGRTYSHIFSAPLGSMALRPCSMCRIWPPLSTTKVVRRAQPRSSFRMP